MMHELAVKLKEKENEITIITPGVDLKQNYKKDTLDGVTILQFSSGKIKNSFKAETSYQRIHTFQKGLEISKKIFYPKPS